MFPNQRQGYPAKVKNEKKKTDNHMRLSSFANNFKLPETAIAIKGWPQKVFTVILKSSILKAFSMCISIGIKNCSTSKHCWDKKG